VTRNIAQLRNAGDATAGTRESQAQTRLLLFRRVTFRLLRRCCGSLSDPRAGELPQRPDAFEEVVLDVAHLVLDRFGQVAVVDEHAKFQVDVFRTPREVRAGDNR
jgi:hypothetical protein